MAVDALADAMVAALPTARQCVAQPAPSSGPDILIAIS
jgi:hypothetical protein